MRRCTTIVLKRNQTNTIKALSGGGGLFNFGPSRGGLDREGGLLERRGTFTKSSDKDIIGSFLFFYPIFCRINNI